MPVCFKSSADNLSPIALPAYKIINIKIAIEDADAAYLDA